MPSSPENPSQYRAMIALEGADNLSPYYDLDWLHRPDVHGGEIQAAFVSSQIAPQSPSSFAMKPCGTICKAGRVFLKAIYISIGSTVILTNLGQNRYESGSIYLMSGEYDCSCTPERMFATAEIRGQTHLMEGMGIFQ